MELGGKIVSIDVEVVDAPFDYNLFLGRSWFYVMNAFESSFFCTLQLPHQGKIVTIDQLHYCTLDTCNHGTNDIPFF